MDTYWEAVFHQLLGDMLGGVRHGTELLEKGGDVLVMTATTYTFLASFVDVARGELVRVAVLYVRGPKRVTFVLGTEDDFLAYCRTRRYAIPERLVT